MLWSIFLYLFYFIVIVIFIGFLFHLWVITEIIIEKFSKSEEIKTKKSINKEIIIPDESDIEKLEYDILCGDSLSKRELKFISSYPHIINPSLIIKDDFYYCVHNYRCSKLSNVPYLYIKGVCSKYGIENYKILENFDVLSSEEFIDDSTPLIIRHSWIGSSGAQGVQGSSFYDFRNQMILE